MLDGRSSQVVQWSFRSPLRSAGRRCSFRRSCTRQGRHTCANGSKWFQARFRCPLCKYSRCGVGLRCAAVLHSLTHSAVNFLYRGCGFVTICTAVLCADIDTAGKSAGCVRRVKPRGGGVGVFGGLFENGKGGGVHKVYTVGKGFPTRAATAFSASLSTVSVVKSPSALYAVRVALFVAVRKLSSVARSAAMPLFSWTNAGLYPLSDTVSRSAAVLRCGSIHLFKTEYATAVAKGGQFLCAVLAACKGGFIVALDLFKVGAAFRRVGGVGVHVFVSFLPCRSGVLVVLVVGVARRGCPAWIDYHNGGTMSTQFFCIRRQPQGVYPVRLAFSAVRVGLSAVSTCPFCAMASRGVVMVFLPLSLPHTDVVGSSN